jgi:excisionase family DNA binding protein
MRVGVTEKTARILERLSIRSDHGSHHMNTVDGTQPTTSGPPRVPSPLPGTQYNIMGHMSSHADTYSLTEAAERLGKSRKTIIRWRKDGKFPNAQLLPGNQGDEWRIPVTDLDELTESEDGTDPGTGWVPQGETLSALVTQVTNLSLELGQTQGQRDGLVSQVDEQTRRIQQLTSDVEQERTARQNAETDTARAVGERDALNGRVNDLTGDKAQLSADLAETRENASQKAESLEADIIDLRDDRERALSAMGGRARRKYAKT